MKVSDPVRLIEAAYTHVPDEKRWLGALASESAPYDLGHGVVTSTIMLGKQSRVRAIAASDGAAHAADDIVRFVENLPRQLASDMFAPTEFVGNGAWRFNRLVTLRRTKVNRKTHETAEMPPLWALMAGNGTTHAVMVAFLGSRKTFAADQKYPHQHRRVLGLVGAHLGAALRLRDALGSDAPIVDGKTTEAILSPDGTVLDATGVGRSPAARRSLSEAVIRAERARGKLRRTDSDEATELWKALVAGRWSIVEIVERDGKRLLLAKANPPSSPDATALTKDESDVTWLIAFGHTYKYVAYELGLTVATVVRRLSAAMLKLGVSTRTELVRKLAR